MAEDVQEQRHDRPGRRGLVIALAVVATVGLPVLLAGQHGSGPSVANAATAATAAPGELPPPPSLPFEQGPPSLPPPPAGTDPATSHAEPVKGMPDVSGCPVDAPTLLKVLRRGGLHKSGAEPGKLTDVDCHDTYAVARAEPASGGRATVVFRYTRLTDSWQAISAGPASACKDIPKAVRTHLKSCN